MRRKLSIVVRTFLATVALAGGISVVTATPAQAAVSCSGSVCIDVDQSGTWYHSKAWFRWTSGRPSMWGHIDLWGPGGFHQKYPASGDTTITDGEGTGYFDAYGDGWVCGEAWSWNGLAKRYESWGRVCKYV